MRGLSAMFLWHAARGRPACLHRHCHLAQVLFQGQ